MDEVLKLRAVCRSFGARSAREKGRLLDRIDAAPRLTRRDLRVLGETLGFIRAHPDDARVLRGVERLIGRLPDANNVYAYSYGVVRRLTRLLPGRLEIEWDDVENEQALLDALDLLVLPGERQGLEDTDISLTDWFARSRPAAVKTDLEFLIDLLERSSLPDAVRVLLFENADLPIRYNGPGRCAVALPPGGTCFQRREIARTRFPLASQVGAPVRKTSRGGQGVIDLALQALCARDLEIYPLIYANPADVIVADCGRGVRVVLIGVLPEWRSPLESLYFFLPLKNGVPLAYGPASVFMGCCEIGVNLFPEFRGAQTRYLYAQIMRVLYHRLGADHFFMTRYAMGENNEDAIRSGAFWFYRGLGFRPVDPAVEAIARAEEKRMARDRGHRSDRRTLRRFSKSEVYLDLSGDGRTPVDFGRLGVAESRFIGERFGGDRRLAERRCASRVARLLGTKNEGRAFRALAPLLSMIEDLPDWTRRDRSALASALRAKDAPSEARAAQRFKAHPRLGKALRAITDSAG